MSGDDDRANAKPSKNPFFDEIDAPPPARARRPKPPPHVITAGGVDMARGHASGIQVKDTGPAHTVDEPRVVLAVETDLRKVPTDKKLLEGRDPNADGSRSAMLPGTPGGTPMPSAAAGGWMPAAAAVPAGAPRPTEEATVVGPLPARRPADRKLPVWMRVAMVAVGLLLLAGVLKRTGVILGDEPAAPAVTAAPRPPAPPPPPAPPVETAAAPEPAAPAPPPPPAAPEPPPPPAPPAEPAAPAPPAHTAKPVQAPGPPKPTFKPPFELPSEKN